MYSKRSSPRAHPHWWLWWAQFSFINLIYGTKSASTKKCALPTLSSIYALHCYFEKIGVQMCNKCTGQYLQEPFGYHSLLDGEGNMWDAFMLKPLQNRNLLHVAFLSCSLAVVYILLCSYNHKMSLTKAWKRNAAKQCLYYSLVCPQAGFGFYKGYVY